MSQASYYALLGLGPNATTAQIETACQQMQRLYQSSGANAARLAELRDIHMVLSDPERRAAYDATLKQLGQTSVRAPAAEPGKALRWLGMLGALVLPLGGIIWWVNRPVPIKPAVPVPMATAETVSSASGGSTDKGQNMLQWQQKMHELTGLQNRKMVIDSRLATFHAAAERGGEASDDELRAEEIEDLDHELAWVEKRIAAINRAELEQAMRGEAPPKQRYPGR